MDDEHEDDGHEGSRWDMHIRDGLVAGKHRKAMGDAVWLYLYLHKHVGFDTGIMPAYRHDVAAAELELSLRSVKLYLERLVAAGYVTVTRRWHCLRVEITRYKVAEAPVIVGSQVQKVASDSGSQVQESASDTASEEGVKCKILPSQVQDPSRGTVQTSLTHRTKESASADGASAPPPAAPQRPTVAQKDRPRRPTRKRSKPARSAQPSLAADAPPSDPDAGAVAQVWMWSNHQNADRAHPETKAEYLNWAAAALALGYPADDLVGCLRYTASQRDKMGRHWPIDQRILSERIGPWQELPGKPTVYKPRDQNGQRGAAAAPFVPGSRDPTPNAPDDAVMCWCNTIEGYNHGRGCGLRGMVTKTHYRDHADWTHRHTPEGLVIDDVPEGAT